MYRKTAVAGYFYPGKAEPLLEFINRHAYPGEKEPCAVVIVPHAGYIYSGATAVKTLTRAKLAKTVIILCPNHTGFGESIAVWSKGSWETPLGDVLIDEDIAEKIISTSEAKSDIVAHVREHAIEVIMPIIKYVDPDIKIVPICLSGMDMKRLKAFAEALTNVIKETNCTIIVSSDMNHYENLQTTNNKDFLAIEQILSVDACALYETVMESGVSMCGVYPAVIALLTAKNVGATSGELVEHTTSAASSGDDSKVVGYAGVIIRC